MQKIDNCPRFPLDVVDCILEQLVDDHEDSDDDTSEVSYDSVFSVESTLKACSTVCRDFAPLCQKRIFSNVALSDDESHQKDIISLRRLEELLSRKSQISNYIRTLKYVHSVDSEMAETFIFSRLRSVTTFDLGFRCTHQDHDTPSWSTITSSFKNALFSFLSSNNIVRLTLRDVKNIPRTIFGHTPGLLSLTTDWVTLDTSDLEESSQLAVPKLKSLITDRGGKTFVKALLLPQLRSSIDLSLLEDIKVPLDYAEPGMKVITEIISQSRRLSSIYIDGSPPFLDMRNTISSCLHVESLKTLKSIQLDINLDNEEQDPYCYLSSELAKISTTNQIQEIDVSISISSGSFCTTELHHWSNLDEVLSQNGAFPVLRRAKIDVIFCHSSAEFESKLFFVRDNAFPLLSTGDQVEFSMTIERCTF